MSTDPTTHLIAAPRHGRYLVDRPEGHGPFPLLVGFHGYGEGAEQMLEPLRAIAGGGDWLLVSVQALNRFYNRANDVVASWMTRQDRELEIADNVSYVSSVIAEVYRETPSRRPLVYAGSHKASPWRIALWHSPGTNVMASSRSPATSPGRRLARIGAAPDPARPRHL